MTYPISNGAASPSIGTLRAQGARQRVMKPVALRAFPVADTARAERLGEKAPQIGLSVSTIRKHLGHLDAFPSHVRASESEVADWSLKSLRSRKPKSGILRLKQAKPTPDRKRPIFDLPVFTGCQDMMIREVAGGAVFHSGV